MKLLVKSLVIVFLLIGISGFAGAQEGDLDAINEAKLKRYEDLGVDEFIYYASLGLGHKEQKRSLELFCSEVMPAFA